MSLELREAYDAYSLLAEKAKELTLKRALELKNKGVGVRVPEGSSWGRDLVFRSPCTMIPLKRKIEVGPELEIQAVVVFESKHIPLFTNPDAQRQDLNIYDRLELISELERMLDEYK
jgi:CRISPR/Cas system-associated protein Csm6